ncbi:glucosamine-6-phosphate deaminase [Chryseobacterium sp. A321]
MEDIQTASTPKNITVCNSREEGSLKVAELIANEIKAKQEKGENIVLGLATGNTPKDVYKELIRMHKEEGLSFKNVISFNLDEYHPLAPEHHLSYHRFMDEQLFNHVDINRENINIPTGICKVDDVEEHCNSYEAKIESLGGIDLQLLGIGRNGHIGFNEPGSEANSKTRKIELHEVTRGDASNEFEGLEHVPLHAITMGVETITKAKKIVLMAFGKGKAEIMKQAISEPMNSKVPASYLQTHRSIDYILDKEAATLLSQTH